MKLTLTRRKLFGMIAAALSIPKAYGKWAGGVKFNKSHVFNLANTPVTIPYWTGLPHHCTLHQIGTVSINAKGDCHIAGWWLDGGTMTEGRPTDVPEGELVIGGYSVAELQAISSEYHKKTSI